MKTFINAGHFLNDPGHVVANGLQENTIVMKVRDLVSALLTGYIVKLVPDELNLADSINWVNQQALPEDMAIDIHLNANNSNTIRGTEAYYWSEPRLAEVFSR